MSEDSTKNSNEDLLRQKLQGFEMPVEDFVFEAIEAQIVPPPPKRKRGILFWATTGTALLVLLALALIFNPFNESATPDFDTLPNNSEINQPQPAASNKVLEDEEFSADHQSDRNQPDTIKTKNAQNIKGEDALKSRQQSQATVIPNTSVMSANDASQEPENPQTINTLNGGLAERSSLQDTPDLVMKSPSSQNPTKNSSTEGTLSSPVIGIGKESQSTKDLTSADELQNSPAKSLSSNDAETPDLAANSPSSQNPTNNASVQKASDIPIAEATRDNTSAKDLTAVDALQDNPAVNSISEEIETSDDVAEAIAVNDSLNAQDILDNGNLPTSINPEQVASTKASKFSAQVFGGGGFSYRILKSAANEELEIHKNDHERSGLSYSFGLGVRYHINEVFYTGLGVGYASYSERYSFNHDLIAHSTANTYNYLQVPLVLGVRLLDAKRVALYAQIGLVWDHLTEAQSSWVDPNSLMAVSHSNAGQQHPFQENAFQGTFGFDVAIKLNNHWQLNLMPSAGIFLNSIYLQSTNLDQKPYSGSLNLGITRRF